MPHTVNDINEKEDDFYSLFLNKALAFGNGEKGVDGIQFRQLVAAAGVVAKQRQTRGAMKALAYQIARDMGKGLIGKNELTEQ